MSKAVCGIFLAFVALGCGSGSDNTTTSTKSEKPVTLAEGDDAKVFPLKVGNQWVYTVLTAKTSQELTLKVSSVSQKDGKTYATVVITNNSGGGTPSEWLVDKNGIFQVSTNGKDKFSPPQLLVPFPISKAGKIPVETTGPLPIGGIKKQTGFINSLGAQEVDTDMGRMSGFAIHSELNWDKVVSTSIAWWTPGIGFIRQRQEITGPNGTIVILMKLKSYSFP